MLNNKYNNRKYLVLIIGTNPLPNFVVAKFFKIHDNYTDLIMICSEETNRQEGTEKYALKIKELLDIPIDIIRIRDISNQREIEESLDDFFKNPNCQINLNFTGGTKTLSVYSYNFLKSKFGNNFKASYLDARNFKIVFDDGHITPKDDLRSIIKLDIKTILELHLYNLIRGYNKEITTCEFIDTLKVMEETLFNEKHFDEYINWVRNVLDKIYIDKNWEKKNKLIEHVKNNNLEDFFSSRTPDFIMKILYSFPQNKRLIDDEKNIWIPDESISNSKTSERLSHTIAFLRGRWLEWHVLKSLKESLNNLNQISDLGMSLIAKKEVREFELDLFFILGYQLVGISVTTDTTIGQCKLKGFEVIHRVRQIGGDESLAVLVTALEKSKAKELQDDLMFSTGSIYGKIFVFCKDDLINIGEKIKQEVIK